MRHRRVGQVDDVQTPIEPAQADLPLLAMDHERFAISADLEQPIARDQAAEPDERRHVARGLRGGGLLAAGKRRPCSSDWANATAATRASCCSTASACSHRAVADEKRVVVQAEQIWRARAAGDRVLAGGGADLDVVPRDSSEMPAAVGRPGQPLDIQRRSRRVVEDDQRRRRDRGSTPAIGCSARPRRDGSAS